MAVDNPFRGHLPFTSKHKIYGREGDIRVLLSNLLTVRWTVVYGPTGVGKSSVLDSGVYTACEIDRQIPTVCFRGWQPPDRLQRLCKAIMAVAPPGSPEFSDDLYRSVGFAKRNPAGRERLLLILDQFEEYLMYTESSESARIDRALAEIVDDSDLDVNILISIREDALAGLDRFTSRMPQVFSNLIRLDYLSLESAKEAIRAPLAAIGIDVAVDKLDNFVDLIKFAVGGTAEAYAVHPLYLSIVLKEACEEHFSKAAPGQFELHGIDGEDALRRHLHSRLNKFPEQPVDLRAIVRNVLSKLTSASGHKWALPVDQLYIEGHKVATNGQIDALLNELTSEEISILRRIEARGRVDLFEVYHDMFCKIISAWVKPPPGASTPSTTAESRDLEKLKKAIIGVGIRLLSSATLEQALTGDPELAAVFALHCLAEYDAFTKQDADSDNGTYLADAAVALLAAVVSNWRSIKPNTEEVPPRTKVDVFLDNGFIKIREKSNSARDESIYGNLEGVDEVVASADASFLLAWRTTDEIAIIKRNEPKFWIWLKGSRDCLPVLQCSLETLAELVGKGIERELTESERARYLRPDAASIEQFRAGKRVPVRVATEVFGAEKWSIDEEVAAWNS